MGNTIEKAKKVMEYLVEGYSLTFACSKAKYKPYAKDTPDDVQEVYIAARHYYMSKQPKRLKGGWA